MVQCHMAYGTKNVNECEASCVDPAVGTSATANFLRMNGKTTFEGMVGERTDALGTTETIEYLRDIRAAMRRLLCCSLYGCLDDPVF